jgi:hypothetical protein
LKDFRSRFFLSLEGDLLEVAENDYREFQRVERHERYLRDEASRAGGVLSLDTITSAENPFYEILADANVHIEQDVVDDLMQVSGGCALHCISESQAKKFFIGGGHKTGV